MDFTFSLTCRALESNPNQTIHYQTHVAVEQFERDHAKDLQGYDSPMFNVYDQRTGVEAYYLHALLAFNHGVVDGASIYTAEDLRVAEVTPEHVTLRGNGDIGSAYGFFDRRSGYGIITQYKKYGAGERWIEGKPGETVHKQWILQCEPSAPAKF